MQFVGHLLRETGYEVRYDPKISGCFAQLIALRLGKIDSSPAVAAEQ